MSRKKKHPEHVNHERWLVSYADFITLLFAFFVVMFAVSQVDSKKVGRFTEAFSKAVGINVLPMDGQSLLTGGTQVEESGKGEQPGLVGLDSLRESLVKMAETSGKLQGLQIIQLRNELVLRLPEGVVFDTGDARVKDGSIETLKLIAPELRDRDVDVRVEGHTDDQPVRSGRYKSNWELSTARATNVMLVLVAEGLSPQRASVSGYGEFRPIASNTSDDGRKQNRRVDLVITAIIPEPQEAQQQP
jgi:chemotaxis protein MotB